MSAAGDTTHQDPTGRPFADLRATGLLWLINTTVFHPRGYALALHFDGKHPDLGACTGWSLMGDGSEPWQFATQGWPEGEGIDEAFAAVNEMLRGSALSVAPEAQVTT